MNYCLLGFLLLWPFLTAAQDDYYQPRTDPKTGGRPALFFLQNGTQLRGELVRQDSTETVVRTRKDGKIRLPTNQIVRIDQPGLQPQRTTYPNLFAQTMRLAPTAFQAERSRAYFRNYLLYFSQFEYGINDNWSVGATFLSFLPTNLFSLNTKLSRPVSGRTRLGISAQYAAVRADGVVASSNRNPLEGLGYVQGILTTGDRQRNTTYGLGWSISNGQVSSNVIGTFGLVRKMGPKLSFISENFVLIGSRRRDFAGLVSGGVRFDRRRHAFDVAAYLPFFVSSRVGPLVTFFPFGSYHLRLGR